MTDAMTLSWRLDGATQAADAPLLLCMHGLGMNEDVFATLLHGLHDLPWNILTLRAPISLDDNTGGFSWYDYDGDQERFRAELRRTDALLRNVLSDAERQLDLQPRRRVLLGFSQGGYCGSYVALMNPSLFAGMVISGARVKVEILEEAIRGAAERGFAALLCHGTRDTAVSVDAARSSLEGLQQGGVAAVLQLFDSGHAIGRAQVAAMHDWLSRTQR